MWMNNGKRRKIRQVRQGKERERRKVDGTERREAKEGGGRGVVEGGAGTEREIRVRAASPFSGMMSPMRSLRPVMSCRL